MTLVVYCCKTFMFRLTLMFYPYNFHEEKTAAKFRGCFFRDILSTKDSMKLRVVTSSDLPESNTNARVNYSNHIALSLQHHQSTQSVIGHCYCMKPQIASVDARY